MTEERSRQLLDGESRAEKRTDQRDATLQRDVTPKPNRRTWAYEVGYAAIVLIAVALVLSPVLRRSGWTLNQGTTAPLLLVQIYAAHFRHLDFFPVWSSTDGMGMGSPVLLYYHRTFYYIAGLIYELLGGGLKQSVVATIAIFLIVGAYGMRFALGLLTQRKLLCVAGSVGFLFTNYVFTDWLDPRGDLAEFSALMIVPWLLYWCINLVEQRRVSFSFVPVMVLLVNAHSAIALTSLVILLVSLATFVATTGIRGLRSVAPRLFVCAAGTVVLLSPLLLAELRFSNAYDPETKNKLTSQISQEFIGFGRYLVDGSHRWFAYNQIPPFFNYVQIDYAIWLPIAAAVAIGAASAGLRWSKRSRRPTPAGARAAHPQHSRREDWRVIGRLSGADGPVVAFLLVSLVIYLFLQLRISDIVYRILSPLQVINFPWRMLGFITPIGIILVVVISDGMMRRYPNRVLWSGLAAAWLVSLILLSPIPTSTGYMVTPRRFSSMSLFMAPNSVDYQTFKGYRTTLGFPPGPLYEIFLPKVFEPNGSEVTSNLDLIALYARLHQSQQGAEALSQIRCSVLGPRHAVFETLQLTFSVKCGGATRLALPVSYNDYSSVFVRGPRGQLHQIPYFHIRTDPRLIIDVTNARPETVVVHLPTLWGSFF